MAWRTNPEGLARRSRNEFGAFLSRPEWQWFTTHTFRDQTVGPYRANDQWQAWLNTLCQTCKARELERPFYFRVTEFQKRGTIHFHSLIGGVGDTRRLLFKDIWELFGYCRVLKYEPNRGANFYVGKYLTKSEGDLRFSHNLKQHLTRSFQYETIRV